MPEGGNQVSTEDLSSIAQATKSIDRMLARTSLLSGQHAASRSRESSQELQDLYVPLPELLSIKNLKHSPGQTESVISTQDAKVDAAIDSINSKLEDRRKRVGNMLTMLGFSDWKKDLQALQRERGIDPEKAGLALVEELIERYREYDFDDSEDMETFRGKKFGGAMSNLQQSIIGYEETKKGIVTRIAAWWTGHSAAAADTIESDKQYVKEIFAKIRSASKDLIDARDTLKEAAADNQERETLFQSARNEHARGNVEKAQELAARADDSFERMYAKMVQADELLHAQKTLADGSIVNRYAINYEAQRERLAELGKKWAAVDASYQKVEIVADAVIRGVIMAAAVGLGMMAATCTFGVGGVVLPFLIGSAMSFGTTFAIGTGGIAAYHGAKALGTAAFTDKEYDWKAAGADIKNSAFESALLGLGGVACKVVGAAVGGVRLCCGLSQVARAGQSMQVTVGATNLATKAWQTTQAAVSSGGMAIVSQLPSNVYHAKKDLEMQNEYLKAEILGNDTLCDYEIAYLKEAARNPLDFEKRHGKLRVNEAGELVDANGNPVTGSILSPADKQNMLTYMMGERGRAVLRCYGSDMLLSFACGMGGSVAQRFRVSSMRSMAPPRVPTVTGASGASVASPRILDSVRSVAAKPGQAAIAAGSHFFDGWLSVFAAERNLKYREEHLGQKITDEDRVRAYSMALSGTVVGNIQGDLVSKRQMQTEHVQDQASQVSTQRTRDGMARDGVRPDVDDPNIHTVIGDAPPNTNGQRFISLGHTDADVRRATEALTLWADDHRLELQSRATGETAAQHNRRVEAEVNAAIENIAANSGNPKKFFETFGESMKTHVTKSLRRQGARRSPGRHATDDEMAAFTEKLEGDAKALAAEAEFRHGRYSRGEGRDTTMMRNIFTKTGEKLRALSKYLTSPFVKNSQNRASTRAANSVYGTLVGKPVRAVGRMLRTIYQNTPFARTAVAFFKQRAIEFPLVQGIFRYGGPGAANNFYGLGGLFGIFMLGGKVMNYVAWKSNQKLGTTNSRPLDASDALASKMDIESLLRQSNELEAAHPNRALSKETKARLQRALNKMESQYQSCTKHNSFWKGSPLLLGTLGVFGLATGTPWPFLAYAAFTGLRPKARLGIVVPAGIGIALLAPPVAPLGLSVISWFGGTKALQAFGRTKAGRTVFSPVNRVASGGLDGMSRILRHDHPLGFFPRKFGRILSGESRLFNFLPVIGNLHRNFTGAFYRNTVQRILENSSRGLHRASESIHPDLRLPRRDSGVEPRLQADLEMAYRRGLQNNDGFDTLTMFRHMEDNIATSLNDTTVPLARFQNDIEVLLREVDPALQNQMIDRLALIAQSISPTDPKRAYMLGLEAMTQDQRSQHRSDLATQLRTNNDTPGSSWKLASSQVRQHLRNELINRVDNAAIDLNPLNQVPVEVMLRQYEHFNGYDSMVNLIRGDGTNPGLSTRARTNAGDPTHSAARQADLTAFANHLDNYLSVREGALNIAQTPDGSPRMRRGEQIRRTDELIEYLRNNVPDVNERLEILTHVKERLGTRSTTALDDAVNTILNSPDAELPSNAFSWALGTDRARVNALAKEARNGLVQNANGQWEIDINARVNELINNPQAVIHGSTPTSQSLSHMIWKQLPKLYRGVIDTPHLRRAAQTCQDLNIRTDSDVDNLVSTLRNNPNHSMPTPEGNAAITWQMRREAQRATDQTLPVQSRMIAEQNLRRMIHGNLEAVRTKFQTIKARSDAAKKAIEKLIKPAIHSDDPLFIPSRDSNFDNLTAENAIARNARNVLSQDLPTLDPRSWMRRNLINPFWKTSAISVNDPTTVARNNTARQPNFWEVTPNNPDYAGYGYQTRQLPDFADQFNWYRSYFEPPAEETYGRTPARRAVGKLLTGPVHNGEISVWGASPTVRATRWLWNRIF